MKEAMRQLVCFLVVLLAQQTLSTNYNNQETQSTSNENSTSSFVLVDHRRPDYCNSPGWDENPLDIEALSGSLVYYQCKNRLTHNKTMWYLNGRQNILNTEYKYRIDIQNNGRTLRFGPVMTRDDGIAINCEVLTKYGYLPSPIGIIRIILPPSFTPSGGSALISKPYYFDFKYSGSKPETVKWFKNGYRYNGEPGRVIVDAHGITFTRVLQRDSGLYYIKATNKAGSASGSGFLRVIYWWKNGTQYQHASSSNPDIPVNVAVAVAIDTNTRQIANKPEDKYISVSSADSTARGFRLMRRLNNRATALAKQQGNSRQEVEDILKQVVSLVGHPLVNINKDDQSKILMAAHCSKTTVEFDCKNETVLKYRMINGTCNNMLYPLNGAAHSPFSRLLPAEYEDGISQPHGYTQSSSDNAFSGPWPSPRFISWRLIKDLEQDEVSHMSHMFMSWGQFIDHDLDLTPIFEEHDGIECDCNFTSQCLPILVKQSDTVFGVHTPHMGECISFVRSIPVCSTNGKEFFARNQINQVTSFMDASHIYGADEALARRLRLGVGGLLKEGGKTSSSGKGNLPFQDEKPFGSNIPFFEAGDERANEQVGLTIMHTVWMREHNRIAKRLGELNSCWSDEKIYQETRKIVGAMLQVITYNEFLPMLFGEYYEDYVPKYIKYNPFIDATIPNSFAAAAFRFGHSLVRPVLMRLDENYLPVEEGSLPLEKAFFNPIEYFKSNGTDPILRGFLVAQAKDVDEFLNSILTSKLFTDGSKRLGVDLASLNIQRGRDHGLAPYRKWQKFCEAVFPGKNATFKFRNTEQLMRQVYGHHGYREGMDLWVGGLSEARLPGAQVGSTFACIIGLTFSKVRDGDRFWYQNPYVFQSFQVRELEKVRLSKVICNNADNIANIQTNAFRTDLPRVSCDLLDDLDLNRWRDFKCVGQRKLRRSATTLDYDEVEFE